MFDNIKTLIVGILGGVLGYLQPISGDIYTMVLIFIMNFVCGYLAGKVANGEDFDFRKAWRCMQEAALFFVMCVCIYALGKFKGNMQGATQCVSTVVYAILYFYATNCMKNIKKMLKEGTPAYSVVNFLYYILSFEIVKQIPVISNYLKSEESLTKKEDERK